MLRVSVFFSPRSVIKFNPPSFAMGGVCMDCVFRSWEKRRRGAKRGAPEANIQWNLRQRKGREKEKREKRKPELLIMKRKEKKRRGMYE